MKIFSKTVTYACHSALRFQDQSGEREVAQVIKAGVGQGAETQKGSALKLRNVFFKKLSFLLCNVATLCLNVATMRKKMKSQLSVTLRH